jgi:hypothetical protein
VQDSNLRNGDVVRFSKPLHYHSANHPKGLSALRRLDGPPPLDHGIRVAVSRRCGTVDDPWTFPSLRIGLVYPRLFALHAPPAKVHQSVILRRVSARLVSLSVRRRSSIVPRT